MKRTFFTFLSILPIFVACNNNQWDSIGKTEVLIETSEGDIVLRLYDDTPLHRDNFIRHIEAGDYDGILFNRIVPDMVIQAGDTTLRADQKAPRPDVEKSKEATASEGIAAEIVYPRHFHKQGALAAAREPDSINPRKESSALQWYIVTGSKYSSAQLAELQATLYEAKVAALFEQLQNQHKEELAQLKTTDYAAFQQLLNDLQIEAEEAMAKNPPLPFTDLQKSYYAKQGGAPHLDGEYTVFGEVVEGMPIALRIGRTPVDQRERPRRAVSIKRISVRKR